MPEWLTKMYVEAMRSPRKPLEEVLADFHRQHAEREAAREVEDANVAEAVAKQLNAPFLYIYLLDKVTRLEASIGYFLAPTIVYERKGFKATVYLTGPVGGSPVVPGNAKLSRFLPSESGEFYLDVSGLQKVGKWPHDGGWLQRLMCQLHLHSMVRIGSYGFKVKQCPYCLRARAGMIFGTRPYPFDYQADALHDKVEACSRRLPIPGGPIRTVPFSNEEPEERVASFST